jgi:hypothetical protein
VEISPLTNTSTDAQQACAISEGNGTVPDMPASPAYIRKLIQERELQEREDMRPRISEYVESENSQETEPTSLASVIPIQPSARSVSKPDGYTISVIDKGRVAIRDAARLLGWNSTTPLVFTVTPSGVTVTESVISDGNVTLMDKQQRCVVPLQARRRNGMKDGQSVLVMTSLAPVAHVRIVTEDSLFDALNKKENEL